MPLSAGDRLGPYEILALSGVGGMGEVYKARDARLGRTVAIKVLPEALSTQPDLLERFEREARTISSLSHPNICALYDTGFENGVRFLVMEYLEGETLAERLSRGPLPLDQFWPVAIQICTALDQAHRRGIVHRDLKPGNIMLTGSKSAPTAKLLDFGLAKVLERKTVNGTGTQFATVANAVTTPGTVLGTFQYMAPEQLAGQEADARTDIFGFGAVLYECAAAKKAFDAPTQAHLISSIMTSEPPPIAPPSLDRIIRRCLAKDPDDRWQSATDLAIELKWASEGGSQTGIPAPVLPRRRNLSNIGWGIAALLGIALLAVGSMHWREQPPVSNPFRFTIAAPDKFSFTSIPALSPDSTKLVFAAVQGDRQVLFLRDLNTLDSKELKGTEGGRAPFWAPDGKEIGFFADRKLKKMDVTGGSPITLADGMCCGAWSKEGIILFVAAGPSLVLHRISVDGGPAAVATRADPSVRQPYHASPQFLPDGRHFLFASLAENSGGNVVSGSLDSLEVNTVMPAENNVAYVSPGILLFTRGDALFAQKLESKSLKPIGKPVQVAEHVRIGRSAAFSATSESVVFIPGGSALPVLTWVDRRGKRLGSVNDPADYSNPALSPDGRTLAVCIRDPSTKLRDIWLLDLVRGTASRFTFDPADDLNPTWSPDGRRLAFTSGRKGQLDLYEKPANGVGEDRLLFASDSRKYAENWSREGDLIYNQDSSKVWELPVDGSAKPRLILSAPAAIQESHLSPDGKFIAYRSVESGRQEIYAQNYPPAAGRWQISNGGGLQAQWNPNGKELFYLQGDRLFAVDIKTSGASLEAGVPHLLFEAPFGAPTRNNYVVSPDGQKFLCILRGGADKDQQMTIVVNWAARLLK